MEIKYKAKEDTLSIGFRTAEEKERFAGKITAILLKWKHLYKDGYPMGRDERKTAFQLSGNIIQKWKESPGVVVSFTIGQEPQKINIRLLLSDEDLIKRKYGSSSVAHIKNSFASQVMDDITQCCTNQ